MKSNNATLRQKLPPAEWVLKAGAVDDVLLKVNSLLRQRRRRRRTAAVATAAALFIAFWLVPFVRSTSTVATLAAQSQTLALADGSQAELNARTALHTDFRYGRRTIRLDQGEAFFSVVKDHNHPFLVETPFGTVRVTGTKFNVRLKEGGAAEVTLLEGSVDFESGGPDSRRAALAPGQQLDSDKGDLRTLTPAEMERKLAWREGRAIFDGDTLREAADRFAAYHGVTIQVAPEVAALHLGGSYPLADLSDFLVALETTLPVRVLRGESAIRVIAK